MSSLSLTPITLPAATLNGPSDVGDIPVWDGSGYDFLNYWHDVRSYGAVGNGTTDDTTAIQAAIDAAHTVAQNDGYATTVWFPPGVYVITAKLIWKSVFLRGAFPNSSVRLIWNGAAGGTMMEKFSSAHAGANSLFLMEGINMRAGSAQPGTFIDFTTAPAPGQIDNFGLLDRVHLYNCTGDAIKVGSWVNLHWSNIRIDDAGGYCIRATPAAGTSLSSFTIDKFSMSHDRTSGAGKGWLYLDFSNLGAVNIGHIKITNARLEVNAAWAAPQALVVIKPGTGATRQGQVHFDNIAYIDGSSMASDVLVYRDTADTNGSESILVTNLVQSGLSAITGGTWPASAPVLPVGNYQTLSLNNAESPYPHSFTSLALRPFSNTTNAASIRVGSESFDRWSMNINGLNAAGGGGAGADVTWGRDSAGTFGIAGSGGGNLKVAGALDHDGSTVGFFGKTPASQPAANADTSGATLGQLETEVNELKAALRSLGIIAT